MAHFVGYSKTPRSKWPYILWSLLIIVLILLIIFLTNFFAQKQELGPSLKPADVEKQEVNQISAYVPSGKIEVEMIRFTNKINNNNQPLDSIIEIAQDQVGRVYCYTQVSAANLPQYIEHVWLTPDEKVYAKIPLQIKRRPAHTWSYVDLYEAKSGSWEVQVRKTTGELLARRSFTVYF